MVIGNDKIKYLCSMKSTLILIIIFSTFSAMLSSCHTSKKSNGNSERLLILWGDEYWSEEEAGDTTTIKESYKIYLQYPDTLLHLTHYYSNGQLKSKVLMRNELLEEIQVVKYTSGSDLYYVDFKMGTGHAIQYSIHGGYKKSEGDYIDGNREGWWHLSL
jgi:hypothetical protein